jgi:hypothetical protein
MSEKPKYTLGLGHATIARLVDDAEIEEIMTDEKWTFSQANPDPKVEHGAIVQSYEVTWVFAPLTEDEYIALIKLFWRVKLPFWRWN